VNTVKNIRLEIEKLGGKVLFNTKLTGIKTQNGRITAVQTQNGEIAANALILSIGHSARDTFKMLKDSGIDSLENVSVLLSVILDAIDEIRTVNMTVIAHL
jgi:uncharacterized FAD-dependent dehydrogenase